MFKYYVTVFLPLCEAGTQEPIHFVAVEYDFDLGLQTGEFVQIKDATFMRYRRNGEVIDGGLPKFSFTAQVRQIRKIVESGVPKGSFSIVAELEIADKEELPAIIKSFKVEMPGIYEDYRLPSLDD